MPNSLEMGQDECGALRAVTGETVRPGGYDLTRMAMNFCGLKAGSTLLDVGCGTGASVEYLIKEFKLAATGIDPSEKMLGLGRNRCAGLPIMKGRAEQIPLADVGVDAILTECSLSHFSDISQGLRECHRVLTAEGWLIVSDLYLRPKIFNPEQCDFEPIDFNLSDPGGFMLKEVLFTLMTASGFEVVLWEDHTDMLKQLTIDIIMQYGSMANFWKNACHGCQSRCVSDLGKNIRLGYYLLIAKKKSITDRR